MTIDTEELIKYLKQPCNVCKDKDTNWCERCCTISVAIDEIESFIDKKSNSAK